MIYGRQFAENHLSVGITPKSSGGYLIYKSAPENQWMPVGFCNSDRNLPYCLLSYAIYMPDRRFFVKNVPLCLTGSSV